MQQNLLRATILIACLVIFFNHSIAQTNCAAKISLIAINPGECNGGVDCDAASEYIEIFNPCFEDVDIGCSVVCTGDWCVTIPSGTVLKPSEHLALGSSMSPGLDAANAKHIDMHNCEGCGWLNPASENEKGLGVLEDKAGQIALFDAESKLSNGIVWNGGAAPAQSEFPLDLILEETRGCAAKAITLGNPADNDQFVDLKLEELEANCHISIGAGNQVKQICASDDNEIKIGATDLTFLPLEIEGCLYTGETVNVKLNTEGDVGSVFWTLSCSTDFPDLMDAAALEVFCDQPGSKTIQALVQNAVNGYTYQYEEDLEILPGLDGIRELQNLTFCKGADLNLEIPAIEGLDSQSVVVNNPPNDPITLTDKFVIDIENLEESGSITVFGSRGDQNCEISKAFEITVLEEDPDCISNIDVYQLIQQTQIFPNPVQRFLNVNYEINKHAAVELTVFDLKGQQLMSNSIQSIRGTNQQQFQVGHLTKGIYMISLTVENETKSFKFVKE